MTVPTDSIRRANKAASYWMMHHRPMVGRLAEASGLSEWRVANGLAYWAQEADAVTDREAIENFAGEHNLTVTWEAPK